MLLYYQLLSYLKEDTGPGYSTVLVLKMSTRARAENNLNSAVDISVSNVLGHANMDKI